MSLTILQIHKRDAIEYKYIQDKYAFNSLNRAVAIADGTTQSFKSDIWAAYLATDFVKDPSFDSGQLLNRYEILAKNFDESEFEFNKNPALASLEKSKKNKGGTSTFLGIQFMDAKTINCIACGDSNLFIVNKNTIKYSFPFSNVYDLDQNNQFINSKFLLNSPKDPSIFEKAIINIADSDTIILATDALSRLIFNNENALIELLQITDFKSLHKFCLKYWNSKELQEDDITAVIFESNNFKKIKEIIPPKSFAFTRAKEIEFIPKNLSNMQFSDHSNEIIQEIRHIKSKLKLFEMLMTITISLLIIITVLLFVFRNNSVNETQINQGKSTITKQDNIKKSKQ